VHYDQLLLRFLRDGVRTGATDQMPTQRVTLAKIGGLAADAIERQFALWSSRRIGDSYPEHVRRSLDEFAISLCAHASKPPVVYFSQWIDMWSLGDLLPGLGDDRAATIDGIKYQACCHRPPIRFRTTIIGDDPPQESNWLVNRLREAEDAWAELVPNYIIVVVREVVGGLVEDNEMDAAQEHVPDWLTAVVHDAKPS
jgi:hypothetical protein